MNKPLFLINYLELALNCRFPVTSAVTQGIMQANGPCRNVNCPYPSNTFPVPVHPTNGLCLGCRQLIGCQACKIWDKQFDFGGGFGYPRVEGHYQDFAYYDRSVLNVRTNCKERELWYLCPVHTFFHDEMAKSNRDPSMDVVEGWRDFDSDDEDDTDDRYPEPQRAFLYDELGGIPLSQLLPDIGEEDNEGVLNLIQSRLEFLARRFGKESKKQIDQFVVGIKSAIVEQKQRTSVAFVKAGHGKLFGYPQPSYPGFDWDRWEPEQLCCKNCKTTFDAIFQDIEENLQHQDNLQQCTGCLQCTDSSQKHFALKWEKVWDGSPLKPKKELWHELVYGEFVFGDRVLRCKACRMNCSKRSMISRTEPSAKRHACSSK